MMELIDVEMHEAFPVRAQPFLSTSKQGRHDYKDLNGIQHLKKRMVVGVEASNRGQCSCDLTTSISRKIHK